MKVIAVTSQKGGTVGYGPQTSAEVSGLFPKIKLELNFSEILLTFYRRLSQSPNTRRLEWLNHGKT